MATKHMHACQLRRWRMPIAAALLLLSTGPAFAELPIAETRMIVTLPESWKGDASGRLLVDHMDADEIRRFIPSDDFVLPDGRRIAEDEFLEDIGRARTQGYVRTTALVDRFTTCLAAPVRDPAGRCIATICFVVPADTTEEAQQVMIDTLKASAERLSPGRP